MSLESILKNARYGLALAGSGVLVAASLLGGGNPVRAEEEMHQSWRLLLAEGIQDIRFFLLWQLPTDSEIELISSTDWVFVPGLGGNGTKDRVELGEHYTFTYRSNDFPCAGVSYDDGYCAATLEAKLIPSWPDIGIVAPPGWGSAFFATDKEDSVEDMNVFSHGEDIYLRFGVGTKTDVLAPSSCSLIEYTDPDGKSFTFYDFDFDPTRPAHTINLHDLVGSVLPGEHEVTLTLCRSYDLDISNNERTIDFTVSSSGNSEKEFTRREVDYLAEYQFGTLADQTGRVLTGTVRFPDTGLRVYLAKDLGGASPKQGDGRYVVETIETLAGSVGLPVSFTQDMATTNFYFFTEIPVEQVSNFSKVPTEILEVYAGFAYFTFNPAGTITYAVVSIFDTAELSQLHWFDSQNLLLHETLHGLGFSYHSDTYERGLMNERDLSGKTLLPIEQRAFELLYSVPVGTTLSELPQLVDIVGN